MKKLLNPKKPLETGPEEPTWSGRRIGMRLSAKRIEGCFSLFDPADRVNLTEIDIEKCESCARQRSGPTNWWRAITYDGQPAMQYWRATLLVHTVKLVKQTGAFRAANNVPRMYAGDDGESERQQHPRKRMPTKRGIGRSEACNNNNYTRTQHIQKRRKAPPIKAAGQCGVLLGGYWYAFRTGNKAPRTSAGEDDEWCGEQRNDNIMRKYAEQHDEAKHNCHRYQQSRRNDSHGAVVCQCAHALVGCAASLVSVVFRVLCHDRLLASPGFTRQAFLYPVPLLHEGEPL